MSRIWPKALSNLEGKRGYFQRAYIDEVEKIDHGGLKILLPHFPKSRRLRTKEARIVAQPMIPETLFDKLFRSSH